MRRTLLTALLALLPFSALADSDVPSLSSGTSLTSAVAYFANAGSSNTKLGFSLLNFDVSAGSIIIKPASITVAQLVSNATTVNGQSCALGSTCTISAAASLVVGSTTITSGTTGRLLYDNAGTLGELILGTNLSITGSTLNAAGGGSIAATAGGNTQTGVTTLAFGNGFATPSGSSGTAPINLAVTDTSKTSNYSIAAGDMANALSLGGSGATLTAPAASSTIFAPGMTLNFSTRSATGNWTLTNSTGLTYAGPTTLVPGCQGALVANADGATLDFFGSCTPTTVILGGSKSIAASGSQFLTGLGTDGVYTRAQPAFTDLSGAATAAQLPLATTGAFGAVKPDGSTITISAGVISSISGGAGTVINAANLTNHAPVIGDGGTVGIKTTAAMSDGQLLVGATGADPVPKTISGSCTLAASGAITCSGGSSVAPIPQGRLTLQTGVPVMTADQSAKTTVYYDSYDGSVYPVWGGSAFSNVTITGDEISMGLDAGVPHIASGGVYDTFGITGGVICANGLPWLNPFQVVTGATNATPIVITANSHGLSNGDIVYIGGVRGNTAANGKWVVASAAANTFALTGSAGNGTYTASTGALASRGDAAELQIKSSGGTSVPTNKNSMTHCWGGASGTTDSGAVSANQGTYLGSLLATANGQTSAEFNLAPAAGGSNPTLGLYNAFNRVQVSSVSVNSNSSHSNSSTTWVPMDNAGANTKVRVTYLDGLAQSPVFGSAAQASVVTNSNFAVAGCNISNVADVAPVLNAVSTANAAASFPAIPSPCDAPPMLGKGFVQGMEQSALGTVTFISASARVSIAQ